MYFSLKFIAIDREPVSMIRALSDYADYENYTKFVNFLSTLNSTVCLYL